MSKPSGAEINGEGVPASKSASVKPNVGFGSIRRGGFSTRKNSETVVTGVLILVGSSSGPGAGDAGVVDKGGSGPDTSAVSMAGGAGSSTGAEGVTGRTMAGSEIVTGSDSRLATGSESVLASCTGVKLISASVTELFTVPVTSLTDGALLPPEPPQALRNNTNIKLNFGEIEISAERIFGSFFNG